MAGQPHEPWQSYSPPPEDNRDNRDPRDPRDTRGYPQQSAHAAAQARAGQGPPQGYQAQHYVPHEALQDQGGAQWQAPAGAPRTSAGEKGFFGALFDFGFTSFVTPKIIKALYVLYTIWMIVWAVIFVRLGFKYGGSQGGIAVLIIVDPIFLLLTLGAYRVILELFMVIHRIHDDVKAIRESSRDRG